MGCALPSGESNPLGVLTPPPSFGETEKKEVLLLSSEGTWQAEVESLAYILYHHGTSYREISSRELNQLPLKTLLEFKLFIIPGGNSAHILQSLSIPTRIKLRSAVRTHGLNYLGLCAGAYLAVSPDPRPGEKLEASLRDSLGLVNGPYLTPAHLAQSGQSVVLDSALFPDGSTQELLWYGGPETPFFPGGVIAQYSDQTPAITQIQSEQGLVVISGLHPSITPWTLNQLNLRPQSKSAPEFTWRLLKAALNDRKLPTF